MFTNQSCVTVFTSKRQGRDTYWYRTILKDVNYHGYDQLQVADKGVKDLDTYVVRVPDDVLTANHYVDNVTWRSLPLNEADSCFTLKKGDYVVKGSVDIDNINEKTILDAGGMKIMQVTENLSASPYSKHVKMVIK